MYALVAFGYCTMTSQSFIFTKLVVLSQGVSSYCDHCLVLLDYISYVKDTSRGLAIFGLQAQGLFPVLHEELHFLEQRMKEDWNLCCLPLGQAPSSFLVFFKTQRQVLTDLQLAVFVIVLSSNLREFPLYRIRLFVKM